METSRVHRLTRNQHLLFRIGELAAYAECAGALCRRAAAASSGLGEKADQSFTPDELASLARVFARVPIAAPEGARQPCRHWPVPSQSLA